MDRETKKIITPAGKEVEIKAYITAGERNQIRKTFLNNVEIGLEEGKPASPKISAGFTDESENKMIEVIVVSFDNSKENILMRLLDSTPEEYDFVVKEIDRIVGGNFPKAK